MNEIAKEINGVLQKKSNTFYSLLSDFGKNIYMPKGIISQSQEAKKHAFKYNATIGIAKENGQPMYLPSLYKFFNNLTTSQIFPYASPYGVPEIRKLWRNKIITENTLIEDENLISLPVVTQALTNGLMLIGDLFIDPDDEIIIPDKLWGNYRLMYEVRYKAKIVNYPFFNSSLTGFNIKALEDVLNKSTKEKIILLFNFPNNPTGYTVKEKEVNEIVEVINKFAEKGKKILIISDDAYYGLFYEQDLIEGSIFSRFVGAHPNIAAIKIDGFTKEYYVWGFRIGFITFADYWQNQEAYDVLEQKTAASIRCSISNCSNTKQSILLKLNGNTEYIHEKKEKYEILKNRFQKVKDVVYEKKYSDCWDVYPFNSGYFMCIKIKGVESNVLREFALKEYGVGTISIGKTDLRIAFSCIDIGQIEEVFIILAKCIRELQKKG
ncbi:MAG: aminotransferase class I/II-fold pyridoxal phosphate-dependent enzyme [Spirochaetes bacterium]|nr:aminotransferase class I/II-fold pyridoxal phosphate-dependent enzyme [Spirochaetota bacterium]